MPISGSLIPFWSFLKSVLIFHHWGFYGTDSIHEKSDGHSLIFQVQMFVMCKEKDRTLYEEEITLWTNVCPPSLTVAEWGEKNDGRDTEEVSSVWNCVLGAQVRTFGTGSCVGLRGVRPSESDGTFFELRTVERVSCEGCDWPTLLGNEESALPSTFEWFHSSVTQQRFDREMQNPFKRSIAIKFKSESYMVLSLSFFIVILVKKKKKVKLRRRQLHYQKHAVLETCQYVYEL